MKKFNFFCFLLALLLGSVFSQTINKSVTLYPNHTIVSQENGSVCIYGFRGIGKYTLFNNTYIDRSYYEFDLSPIEDNATITQVQVNYSMSGLSYTFKLTKIASLSGDLQAHWNAVGNGTALHTGLTYGNSSFYSETIKTEIANALGNNQLIIGGLSEAEATTGSESSLDLNLYVEYTIPAQLLNLTVRNDLYGADSGNIGAAVYPQSPVSHTSPYEFTAYEGQRLNLAAYDNQSINNKVWFFNNTEYGNELSIWVKEKNGEKTILSNSQSFTTSPLTVEDDNAIFIAYLKTTTYTTSGTMSSNEKWFTTPISLTGNVSVASGVTLTINSGTTVNLNGYNLTSTGGTIIVEPGATLNPDIRLQTGSTINGLYPSINAALSAASSGQTIVLRGPHTLTNSYSIPSGLSLSIQSGATINLGSYSIVSSGGILSVASGATINPDVRRKSGSTLLGLYPSIGSALSAASSGQTVEYGGSHTMSSMLTVPTGITLVAKAGSTISFPGYYYNCLVVNGNLNVFGTSSNRATFSSTSGTWGGIRYQSGSSGSIQYANISNANYGIYASYSYPTISHSSISNCSYGVYAYYSSPTLSNNTISNCTYGVYLNNSNNAVVNTNAITGCTRGIFGYYAGLSDFVDNYITSGGALRVAGIQVYNTTEPTISNNTIEGSFTYGLDADHYSRPLAIGPGSQNYQGYNRIIGGQTATVYTHDHSETVLGTSFTQSTEGYAGYNTIYLDIGTDRIAHIRAENYSNILAQKNYWGDYPPQDFYADGTSSINYSYPLSSDPGGGSSLGKIIGGLLADALMVNIYPFAEVKAVETLWQETTALWQSLRYRKALENCNTLLQNYPESPYAPLAFLRSVFAKRALKSTDLKEHLQKYVDTKNLRTMALELLIGEDITSKRFKAAVEKSKTVIRENPDTEAEYKALFTLFNIYTIDLGNREEAQAVLNLLKAKYADYSLTQMAQFEMGETVDWQLAKPIAFGKQPAPPAMADIIPDKYQLKPSYPNPFNPTTNISFALPEASNVQISIYDLTGREVWRSAKSYYPAGNYTITWQGVNQAGESVVSGIYFVRMSSPKYTATQRILLMK